MKWIKWVGIILIFFIQVYSKDKYYGYWNIMFYFRHRCKLPIEMPLKNLPESYDYVTCHEEPVIEQTVYVNDNNELLMKTGNS